MKTTLVSLTFILTVSILNAQTITENYIKKLPSLPKDSCNVTRIATDNFKITISDLITEIDNEIEKLNAAEKIQNPVNEEAAKEKAMQQMSQQYGLSQEQMNQMKNGKMSAADKQALANQVLQQQTNMSMDEVKNMSKMSESGRKAYAEALGTEIMATSQAGGTQAQGSNNAKTLNQLISERQVVLNKINVDAQKIGNQYAKIESDPELLKSYQKIENWQSKLMSMSGVEAGQGDRMDSLAMLIKNEQVKICNVYTPRYRVVLKQHLASMKASIPDIYQLGKVTAQITELQTGIVPPAESTEIGCLESVKGYLAKLEDAYKFKLYFPEENE